MISRLLLDAGNTRLKWAWLEGGQWREHGVVDYDALERLTPRLCGELDCVIASVAGAERDAQIGAWLMSAGVVPRWLDASHKTAALDSLYAPGQLGVDRLLALIAARQRSACPALVVSAGTAVTIDALDNSGVFLGGLIVPGLRLMRQALANGTARVGEGAGYWQAFPKTTADAVQSGAVDALCGAIEAQYARLRATTGSAPHCLLTGGDADALRVHLQLQVEPVPLLVLEGIEYASREGTSE